MEDNFESVLNKILNLTKQLQICQTELNDIISKQKKDVTKKNESVKQSSISLVKMSCAIINTVIAYIGEVIQYTRNHSTIETDNTESKSTNDDIDPLIQQVTDLINFTKQVEDDLKQNPPKPDVYINGYIFSYNDQIRMRAYYESIQTLNGIKNLIKQTKAIKAAYLRNEGKNENT